MAFSHILSRRSVPNNHPTKEDTNKSLRKSPSYFGRLASFSLLRKKSSISEKKQPITIRRIYPDDYMVNFNFPKHGEVDDSDEYCIDEILSPYSDDISEICTYIERPSEMSVEHRPYQKSIACSNVNLKNTDNNSPGVLEIKQVSRDSTKEIESPSTGSSIFEKADSLMFEDDVISHSTSKHSLLLSKQNENDTENCNFLDFMKNEQYIDTGSISDANIEVFKTPANKLNLKLIPKHSAFLEPPSSPRKFISSVNPVPDLKAMPNDASDALNIDKINLSPSNAKGTRIAHESMYLAKGNFEVNSHDIYKNEMAMLVEEHKLIISKHEKEISYLKDLLQEERKINKLLTSYQQRRPNLKIESSQTKKMRRKFIPIEISVGSGPGSPNNKNELNNLRDRRIIFEETSPSPFLTPIGYKAPTKDLSKSFIREGAFPIAPTINHSTPEGLFCTGVDKQAWKNTKEKQRKDAYYALTHNTSNDNGMSKNESIDFANLNKVFNSSKSAMKTNNSIESFDSHLTTPDFSNSDLLIHA